LIALRYRLRLIVPGSRRPIFLVLQLVNWHGKDQWSAPTDNSGRKKTSACSAHGGWAGRWFL
jgi:hypothetical protein